MIKVINVNYTSVICDVTHSDNIEHWSFSRSFADAVVDALKKNGAEVIGVNDGFPSVVSVDRSIYHFGGETYHLDQCEGDIYEWAKDSSVYDFTYYYDKVVFHTQNGIIAAYRDDINNTIKL